MAVEIAKRHNAKLCGLAITDTSHLLEQINDEGSAASAAYEYMRLSDCEKNREELRSNFTFACLAAGLDFELQSRQGKASEILQRESRFYDLLITAVGLKDKSTPNELSTKYSLNTIFKSHAPTMVLREQATSIDRILLVHDGSTECSRTIKTFIAQDLFPNLTYRLLAIAPTQEEGEHLLRGQYELIKSKFESCELGYLVGNPAKVLPEYVNNWKADLVVYGVRKSSLVMDKVLGHVASRLISRTTASVYSA
ncbi:universal stress protein [Planctomicrobium sp. SH527]|uniref:universal stress protein n=1 Tax=Planctomicrobium sp. SH527 TaxID=3448123 RepID=UPI003F5C3E53